MGDCQTSLGGLFLEDSILKTHQLLVAAFTSLNRLSNSVSLPARDCDMEIEFDNCAATMTKNQNYSSKSIHFQPLVASWFALGMTGYLWASTAMQRNTRAPSARSISLPCILCLVAVETRAPSYQSVTSVRDTMSHCPVESWHDFVISRCYILRTRLSIPWISIFYSRFSLIVIFTSFSLILSSAPVYIN